MKQKSNVKKILDNPRGVEIPSYESNIMEIALQE